MTWCLGASCLNRRSVASCETRTRAAILPPRPRHSCATSCTSRTVPGAGQTASSENCHSAIAESETGTRRVVERLPSVLAREKTEASSNAGPPTARRLRADSLLTSSVANKIPFGCQIVNDWRFFQHELHFLPGSAASGTKTQRIVLHHEQRRRALNTSGQIGSQIARRSRAPAFAPGLQRQWRGVSCRTAY